MRKGLRGTFGRTTDHRWKKRFIHCPPAYTCCWVLLRSKGTSQDTRKGPAIDEDATERRFLPAAVPGDTWQPPRTSALW